MIKRLRVFHGLVNYGTQAGLFAQELRNQGIRAISVVKSDHFQRQSDVELQKGKNPFQRYYLHIWNFIRKLFWFFSYNTFHFYFGQTLLNKQKDLPFYRIFGKKVIMEYLGNDIRNYKSLIARYNLPSTHDFCNRMDEHDKRIAHRIEYEKKYIDYRLSCLPTHIDFAKEYNYHIHDVLPLAIDLSGINYTPLVPKKKNDRITVLHAPTNRVFKGTEYIECAINQLTEEGYKIDFKLVEGVTHKELFRKYEDCDIFIDQISIGWYGTAALEAMAFGRPTCAYIDDRYFQYIDYQNEIPVINIDKYNLVKVLRELFNNRSNLPEIGNQSRKFIEKYHDIVNVTTNLINIYQQKL